MVRRLVAVVAMSLAFQAVSNAASAFSKRTDAAADADLRRLLRLMDKDKNGTVSKNEFVNYLLERFDKLDVDHDRRLAADELRAFIIPNCLITTKPNCLITSKPTKGQR
jgi:Ca2+-binding EF-hand superfamily protein